MGKPKPINAQKGGYAYQGAAKYFKRWQVNTEHRELKIIVTNGKL